MSALLENSNSSRIGARMQQRVCDVCGTRMRIRLTGPEVLAGNKRAAVYLCECGHEQNYVEDLWAEADQR